MPIFVDTDNTNPTDKLFRAGKAGAAAAKAEAKMQATVKKILDKTAGFTTTKVANAKGYTVRMEVSKLDVGGGNTKCTLTGSIVRYPKGVTMKGAKGDEMLSLGWTGSGEASGTSEGSLLDCVEAVAENMMKKNGISTMNNDFLKR